MALSLGQARRIFSVCLVDLLYHNVQVQGLSFAFDEVTDRKTAKDPTTDHMVNSLHEIGLAADVLLFRDGVYLTSTEDYRVTGEAWERLGIALKLPLKWGGRFNDGNHFSFSWLGRS